MTDKPGLEALNRQLLRAISAYGDRHYTYGRCRDVPMEDRNCDLSVTLRQLRLLQSSLEWRLEAMENEK
jgi:hypothetical protein